MSEENEEMKIAITWIDSIKCECPYCGKHQDTYFKPGETDTCMYCDKEFELGDFE